MVAETAGQAAGATLAFGEVLKRFRRAAGLTQELLAERAGYSTVYISMLERGQRAPQTATVEALAAALELRPRDRAGLLAAARTGDRATSGWSLSGRDHEIDLLRRHLSGEGPPMLLVAGEPGIGKSRLLAEVAGQAAIDGMAVLAGGCLRRGGQEPYAPLLNAIQRQIRDSEPDQLRADLEGCAWLVRLLPELTDGPIEPLPPWALSAEGEHRLMSQAVIRFLRNVSGPAGTVLLLDDLQWAGSDALDLLALLVRAAGEASVRLIGAYRDTEVHVRHPLSDMLADLAQAGLARHVSLSALPEQATAALLDELLAGANVPAAVRDRTLRRTGGVPFFVVSCAQSLRVGSTPESELPWDLAQSVRQRLGALTQRAEETLGVAAVIGRRVPFDLLAAAGRLDEEDALDDLEQACRLRLLDEDGESGYLFTHDVVREVVEHDLGAARRAQIHRRIGMVLEDTAPTSVEALAYHFTRSGDGARAVRYLELAGDAARAQHAAATAEGYYRELVDRLDSMDERTQAARAREKLGDTLSVLALYPDALEVFELAASQYRQARDLEGEARVAAQIGRLHYRQGTAEEGIARLDPLREYLRALGPSRSLAELGVALAPLFMSRERYQDQLAAAESAATFARTVGDDRLLAEAEVWRGCALNQLGHWEEGRSVQEAAIPLCEAENDLASLSHALNDVAFAHEAAGRFDRSRFYKKRALEVAERQGDPAGIANMAFRCGQLAFLEGAWDDARAHYLRAHDLLNQLGGSAIGPYPYFGLARLALVEGSLADAMEHARNCLTRAQEVADRQATQAALALMAECELRSGDAASARERLREIEPGEDGLALYNIAPIIAEVHLAAGDRCGAREWAERSVTQARSSQNRVDLVDSLCIRAQVAQADDPDAARADLDEALATAREIGYRPGETRAGAHQSRLARARA